MDDEMPTFAEVMEALDNYRKAAHDCGVNVGKEGTSITCEFSRFALRDLIKRLAGYEDE
jgi:hypothetical protein